MFYSLFWKLLQGSQTGWGPREILPEPEEAALLGGMIGSLPCQSGSLLVPATAQSAPPIFLIPEPGITHLSASLTSPRRHSLPTPASSITDFTKFIYYVLRMGVIDFPSLQVAHSWRRQDVIKYK